MSEAWLKLTVPVADREVARLEDLLLDLGALSVAVAARDDLTPRFHTPGEPEPALWANCEVEGLFDVATDPLLLLASIAAHALPVAGAAHEVLADRDWQQSFRQQFAPREFTGNLWVVPSWHTPPAGARHVITLDPGMAFGTGTHPTTGLCLDWLGSLAELRGASVLDYGCGSGILAIAAARLGARRVIGLDIDPGACEVARENALANDCGDIDMVLPGQLPAGTYDVLIANILMNPLLELAATLAGLIVAGGAIGLSGLLVEQAEAVRKAYARWFDLDPTATREDWAFISGRRRP